MAELLRTIVSIDVGVEHLGLVAADIGTAGKPWGLYDIWCIGCIDIRMLRHVRVKREDCKLYHTSHISDLVDHFVQEYGSILDRASEILMEKQPPTGMCDVEALLFNRFRDKMVLMSATTMHAYHGIGHLEYDDRKAKTTEIGHRLLVVSPNVQCEFEALERKHDVGDALAYLKMYIEKKAEAERRLPVLSCKRTESGPRVIAWDAFKFHQRNTIYGGKPKR